MGWMVTCRVEQRDVSHSPATGVFDRNGFIVRFARPQNNSDCNGHLNNADENPIFRCELGNNTVNSAMLQLDIKYVQSQKGFPSENMPQSKKCVEVSILSASRADLSQ